MRIAFCLFKYFPYGGMQRDALRIARLLLARGHAVELDRKSTRLNSSHIQKYRMPSSA